MSFVTHFGKRKIYLVNHDPLSHHKHLEDMGVSFSKFLVLQTINEFRDAVYNDFIAGELFSSEAAAQRKLHADEYYLELLIPVDAISHALTDGHVFIKPGFAPKILSLKTAQHITYKYDELLGFHEESVKMSTPGRRVYNYNPDRWPLFTAASASRHYESMI